MKIKLISDLHLEGFNFKYTDSGEDLLILAGDIHTKNRHSEILNSVPSHIMILMVPGNHEYYRSDFDEVNQFLKNLENNYSNFHFLNNDSFTINNISIFGGAMFTDFQLYTQETALLELDIAVGISDFLCITKTDIGGQRYMWTTQNHKEQYQIFNQKFDEWIVTVPSNNKKICISHFLPSEKSIDAKFKLSNLNPYFAANNEDRVKKVDYFVHGHAHSSHDYMIGNTRIMCNPKGYGFENKYFAKDFLFEV